MPWLPSAANTAVCVNRIHPATLDPDLLHPVFVMSGRLRRGNHHRSGGYHHRRGVNHHGRRRRRSRANGIGNSRADYGRSEDSGTDNPSGTTMVVVMAGPRAVGIGRERGAAAKHPRDNQGSSLTDNHVVLHIDFLSWHLTPGAIGQTDHHNCSNTRFKRLIN